VKSKKQGYEKEQPLLPTKKMILEGLKDLKEEIIMWKDEVKEKLETDPILIYRPNEIDVYCRFNTIEEVEKWIVTSDSDHNEGYSRANFELSTAGYGLFNGIVTANLPKDGRIKKAGYASIRSQRHTKSFRRNTYYDWSTYNTLVLRVRGDGRPYMINIGTEGTFDVTWNDIYHFVLYTRGGPHWQITKIPFSKFFLASNGVVQDKQFPIPLNKITSFGFAVSGRGGFDGPFSLEIDYIGLEYDPSNIEEFAYEMYKQEKYIVAT
jgi:NADH dehydrogenase [ubiquinone] 1 alpha subcomplex assembly factor 1